MNLTKYAIMLALTLFAVNGASADDEAAAESNAEPAKKYVEKIVFVPEWVTETQVCKETRYRTETKDKEVVEYECKQVTKEVPYQYQVWVREPRTETQTIQIDKPVYRWEDQTYHIYVPSTMTVTRYRTKTECKPVTVTKTVCDEHGNKQDVECTENKLVCTQEPYECEVPICVPVPQTRRVKVYETKTETKSIPRTYETIVQQTRTKMVKVCYEDKVPITKRVPVEVCVPYTVDVEKKVRVCKMVPKTVRVPCE